MKPEVGRCSNPGRGSLLGVREWRRPPSLKSLQPSLRTLASPRADRSRCTGRAIERQSYARQSGSLLFKLDDRLYATDFVCSEDHLIARLHGVEHQAVLYLEILGARATARRNRSTLRLLN